MREKAFPDLPAPRQRGNAGVDLFDAMQMHQYALRCADGFTEELVAAARAAVIALAHAAESDPTYQQAYEKLGAAIRAAA